VFYVYFTALDWADTIMAFHVSASPNVADPASGKVVLAIPDREPNHNGGMLAFGPDGHLYVGIGDEGGHNDEYGNGQNLNTLFGKLLRIDPHPAGGYDVPAGNPCAGGPDCRPEVWAYGLRNPWRFSFDRASGDLYIADVGEADWEEIDIQPAGATQRVNYGWNRAEATHCFPAGASCDLSGIQLPVVEYSHDLGCSITGGYVYHGSAMPALAGAYLFGDFCSGRIWSMTGGGANPTVTELLHTTLGISSFGEDDAGELYVTDLTGGAVYRLIANTSVQRTWQRTDQPVASGQASRTWMWGPGPDAPALTETYAQSPGGFRTVQYFDKSRMELTQPTADAQADWYVTNGLLSRELISGKLQLGDAEFDERAPAAINVAGDEDDSAGPTYGSFTGLLDATPAPDGAPLTQRVDRAGHVSNDASLAARGVTAAYHVNVPGLNHQVASPFWDFMISQALVYQNGAYVDAPLFSNPFYATGYPITEAYWARVKVAGTEQDVLMQCFERRCLTYTPANAPGWQVEAGNVGRHYFEWRYGTQP
jgi:hypothetical protein